MNESGEDDAGSAICAHLLVEGDFTLLSLGRSIGLPPVVLEEAVRNARSSFVLRFRLLNWIRETPALLAHIPEKLLQSLQQDVIDEGTLHLSSPNGGGKKRLRWSEAQKKVQDEVLMMSGFKAFDDVARERFTVLEETVGQSVMSIFNSPSTEAAVSPAWSWLGGNSVFDHYSSPTHLNRPSEEHLERGNRKYTGRGEESRLGHARGAGVSEPGDESSAALLQEHMGLLDVNPYIELVSPAFQANRLAGRDSSGPASPTGSSVASQEFREEVDEVLPEDIPASFFVDEHDVAKEIGILPAPHTNSTAAPPRTGTVVRKGQTPASGTSTSATAASTIIPPPPKLAGPLRLSSFERENDIIESRLKELNAWECSVEASLLTHVQRRSEDFFLATREFSQLHLETENVLHAVKETINSTMKSRKGFVEGFLKVGGLYRARSNARRLHALIESTLQTHEQIANIENWVSLPERDVREMPSIVHSIHTLESTIYSSAWINEAGSLRYTSDWSKRVEKVKERVRGLVDTRIIDQIQNNRKTTIGNVASGQYDSGEAAASPSDVVMWTRCAIELGSWETCVQRCFQHFKKSVWSITRAVFVDRLLKSKKLDDASASNLLECASKGEDDYTRRKQTLAFASKIRFPVFLEIYTEVLNRLQDLASQVSLQWSEYVLDSVMPLVRSLTSEIASDCEGESESGESLRRKAMTKTRELLEDLLKEVESIFIMLVESLLSDSGNAVSLTSKDTAATSPNLGSLSNDEVLQIAQLSFSLIARLTATVKDVEAVFGVGDDGNQVLQVHVEHLLQPAIQCLVHAHFCLRHDKNKRNFTVLLENEKWSPAKSVDPSFQSQLDALCASDGEAYKAFGSLSVETGMRGRALVDSARAGNRISRESQGRSRSGNQKLYITADDSDEGRTVHDAFFILIDMLYDYNTALGNYPSLAHPIVLSIHEMIDFYDQSAAELILGGKAVRNGSLSSVTPLNLATLSQCFAFLSEFIPHLTSHLLHVLDLTELAARITESRKVVQTDANRRNKLTVDILTREFPCLMENCATHHRQCFTRIIDIIRAKVGKNPPLLKSIDSRGKGQQQDNGRVRNAGPSNGVAVQRLTWSEKGNTWMMDMLKETAKLIRNIRESTNQRDMDCIIVPLIGGFAHKMREITRVMSTGADPEGKTKVDVEPKEVEEARSSVLVYNANVHKFGYNLLECVKCTTAESVLRSKGGFRESTPCSEEDVLGFFFG